MALDTKRVRTLLQQFDLRKLFIEELGWDHHQTAFDLPLDGGTYHLSAVAHKRGVIAFMCKPAAADLPDYATRRKIERVVAKTHAEHLIVFVDPAQTTQLWQWVKREPGRPAASREHTWHKSQSGEALIQKLGRLVFTLAEEESVTILDSTGRVRAGFDVERVTKRFYERFKTEHSAFTSFIKGIPDDEMLRWYVSVMLNRLMFIYFIQKKGFLNGDPAYLRTKLAASKQAGKDRFYKHFLCPLFFEGFAVKADERSPATNALLGQVPYLNGGLFLRHQIEEQCGEKIQIADAAFEKIFAFFDAYQWHLDERPLRQDDEINPDVLGYIFEKYINQKQMGAYYTKEDITEYIGKNTIVPFLFDAARKECPIAFKPGSFLWKLLSEDPDRYIYAAVRKGVIDDTGHVILLPDAIEPGIADVSQRTGWNKPADPAFALPTETWREHVARRQRCLEIRRKLRDGEIHEINDLITLNLDIRQFAQDVIAHSEGPELVRAFYQAIEKLTVLDPTCGSGAFLFAALNVLQPLYEACLERMAAFLAEAERSKTGPRPEKFADFRKVLDRIKLHPNHDYFVLKSIIVNNLYGVDIMEEAVEICRLRLFLKLVAQVEKVEQIEPLPDIDFNIRAGNTLVGYATQADAEDNLNFGNAITRIGQKAAVFDLLFQKFRRHQLEDGPGSSTKDSRQFKQDMLKPLTELRQELDEFLALAYGNAGKGGFEPWRKSHQPFHWFVEFYGIMHAGGFDVIIGNPPYVEYSKVRRDYQLIGFETLAAGNLYAMCSERSFKILGPTGRFGFIVQAPIVSTQRMAPVRRLLLQRSNFLAFSTYDDRPSKLFDGMNHCRVAIILAKLGNPQTGSLILTTQYLKWYKEERPVLLARLAYSVVSPESCAEFIPKVRSEEEANILAKLAKCRSTLGSLAAASASDHRIYYKITGVGHWFTFTTEPPRFWRDGNEGRSTRENSVRFATAAIRDTAFCVLWSTLHYWLYQVRTNCRDFNPSDLECPPVPNSLAKGLPAAHELASRITKRLVETSEIAEASYEVGGTVRYQKFRPKSAKPIVDEVDAALAPHYGLTKEELDFIINYDIKYRMGADDGEADTE